MFASSKLKNHKSSDNKQRLFRYTEIIDRNFPMHFKPIPKIRAIHQTIVNSDGISATCRSFLVIHVLNVYLEIIQNVNS